MHVFAEIRSKSANKLPANAGEWESTIKDQPPPASKWASVHSKWAPMEAMHTFTHIVIKPRQTGCVFESEVKDIVGAISKFGRRDQSANHLVGVVLTPDELDNMGIRAGNVCQSDEHAANCARFGRVGTSARDSYHRVIMAVESTDATTSLDMLASMTPCTRVVGHDSVHRFDSVGGNVHLSIDIREGDGDWSVSVQDDRTGRSRTATCESHVGAFSTALNTIAEMETLPHTSLMRALNTVPLERARKRAYNTLILNTVDPVAAHMPNAWMTDIISAMNLARQQHVKKMYDHVMGAGAWAAFTQNPVDNQFIGPRSVIMKAHITAVGTVVPHCYEGARLGADDGSKGSVLMDNPGGEPYTVAWDCSTRDVYLHTALAAFPPTLSGTIHIFADDIECTPPDCFMENGTTTMGAMEKIGLVRIMGNRAIVSSDAYMISSCGVLTIRIDRAGGQDVEIHLRMA